NRSVRRDVVGVHPTAAGDLDPLALRADGGERLTSRQAAGLAIVGSRSRTDAQVRGRAVGVGASLIGRTRTLLVTADVGARRGAGAGADNRAKRALILGTLAAGQAAQNGADRGACLLATAGGVAVGDAVGLRHGGGAHRHGGGTQGGEHCGGGQTRLEHLRHMSLLSSSCRWRDNAPAKLKAPPASPLCCVHV